VREGKLTPEQAEELKVLASRDIGIVAISIDQRKAVERAQPHLEAVAAQLRALEDRAVIGEPAAADELIDGFRSGEVEAPVIEAPATSNLDQARRSVEVARQAFDTLTTEVSSTQRELQQQHRVGLCLLDVKHDRAAAQRRANLQQAGFVTASLRQRHNWPARIFTSSTLAVTHSRPPTATLDWQDFIARLFPDADAELG
jgi:hypothetical protein